MLPDIRAVIAAIVAAACLLIVAFVAVAMFRVAQETRVASLQADLAQRAHPVTPEPPHRVTVIETPGPTLLAKAPVAEPILRAVEPAPMPASKERASAASEASAPQQNDAAPTVTAAIPESALTPEAVPQRESDDQPSTTASVPTSDVPVAAANDAALDTSVTPTNAVLDAPAPPPDVVAAPQEIDTAAQPPSPALSVLAMGGPSPEEIAQAKARHELAKRARARRAAAEARKAAAQARKAAEARKAAAEARKKIAAEKARKTRAARLARQRKLVAARREAEAQAKQQATPAVPQPTGFGFNTTSSFTSAPFANPFNTNRPTTNWR